MNRQHLGGYTWLPLVIHNSLHLTKSLYFSPMQFEGWARHIHLASVFLISLSGSYLLPRVYPQVNVPWWSLPLLCVGAVLYLACLTGPFHKVWNPSVRQDQTGARASLQHNTKLVQAHSKESHNEDPFSSTSFWEQQMQAPGHLTEVNCQPDVLPLSPTQSALVAAPVEHSPKTFGIGMSVFKRAAELSLEEAARTANQSSCNCFDSESNSTASTLVCADISSAIESCTDFSTDLQMDQSCNGSIRAVSSIATSTQPTAATRINLCTAAFSDQHVQSASDSSEVFSSAEVAKSTSVLKFRPYSSKVISVCTKSCTK